MTRHLSPGAITDKNMSDGDEHPTLGPHYFASRDFAEKVMRHVEAEHFEPALKKFADAFYGEILDRVSTWLVSDAESNLQSSIWRMIDEVVDGILSGKPWVMQRYALGTKYNCEAARKAIAEHIPRELQDARIADLEAEVERLREDNKWLRQR